jgi:hypothetical protein
MEQWKDIKNYEGLYEISSIGNVKRGDRYLKPRFSHNGYYRIGLCKNSKQKWFQVHRLVAEAFIENPENKNQVNHKDGNKINNDINNLEWMTNSENIKHAYDVLGFINPLKKKVKLTKGDEVLYFDSGMEAAKHFGLSKDAFHSCRHSKCKMKGYDLEIL